MPWLGLKGNEQQRVDRESYLQVYTGNKLFCPIDIGIQVV